MTSSPVPAASSQYLLDLLAQVPDPRKKRGRRHPLAGLLAVGNAAVIAGAKSFAAIGQWAAEAGPEALAVLGAVRGAADESTFRRAFALVSPDVLDGVLGAWLWTRAMRAGGRLVIAIDGKTVRGARNKAGKAPHLVAAMAHGIGAVLGQVAVEAKSNESCMAWRPPRSDEMRSRPAGRGRRRDTGALRVRNESGAGPAGPGIVAASTNPRGAAEDREALPAALRPLETGQTVTAERLDDGSRVNREVYARF
jgi:hypothetical protein